MSVFLIFVFCSVPCALVPLAALRGLPVAFAFPAPLLACPDECCRTISLKGSSETPDMIARGGARHESGLDAPALQGAETAIAGIDILALCFESPLCFLASLLKVVWKTLAISGV